VLLLAYRYLALHYGSIAIVWLFVVMLRFRIGLMDEQASTSPSGSDSGTRVTFLGMGINIFLVLTKVAVGILTGSVGLTADGIHSGSDIATDLAVLGGIHLSSKPADSEHPYGHGRYETLAGGAVAIAVILVGIFIAWEGGSSLYAGQAIFPGLPVIIVASFSILLKELVYRRTIAAARELSSPALHANAWHHRSDALSSVAVLFGGIGGLLGWGHADQVAGILVGGMVVVAGAKTVHKVMHELTEGGLSSAELSAIQQAIESVKGVRSWYKLRTHSLGRQVYVDLRVLVDPSLSLIEGHSIATKVENAVSAVFDREASIIVHVEPDDSGFDQYSKL
jgi:cation diffusion facilitator family transporter